MKTGKNKPGVTLIEAMIVIAIITTLLATIMTVAARLQSQSKERLTSGTIKIVSAALEQFNDYGYRYDITFSDSSKFQFPMDCNDFDEDYLIASMENALGLISGDITIDPPDTHLPAYSGSEAMYFFLSRVQACRNTLNEIDSSMITNKGIGDLEMNITINFPAGQEYYPLFRIVDAWGNPLRYDYYDENIVDSSSGIPLPLSEYRRSFPLITSAGHDKTFDTADDIDNK